MDIYLQSIYSPPTKTNNRPMLLIKSCSSKNIKNLKYLPKVGFCQEKLHSY